MGRSLDFPDDEKGKQHAYTTNIRKGPQGERRSCKYLPSHVPALTSGKIQKKAYFSFIISKGSGSNPDGPSLRVPLQGTWEAEVLKRAAREREKNGNARSDPRRPCRVSVGATGGLRETMFVVIGWLSV